MNNKNRQKENLIILGGGPGGLSASIYAARNGVSPLILNGPEPGGQITTTSELENYPGFPNPVGGFELTQRMTEQAENFGVRLNYESAEEVDFSGDKFIVKTENGEYAADSIIIATGAEPRTLGLKKEDSLRGNGVSYCATCDAAFFRNKEVAIVGGGDTALWESTFLAKFASKVYILHRRDKLRGAQILADRVKAKENIEIIWNTEVESLKAENKLEGINIFNNKTNEKSFLDVQGLFIAIGYKPRTKFFNEQIELNDSGYIVTDKRQRTNIKGVFACGDVQDPDYRQVVIAAGSGAKAAIEAAEYIEEKENSFPAKEVKSKNDQSKNSNENSSETAEKEDSSISLSLSLD